MKTLKKNKVENNEIKELLDKAYKEITLDDIVLKSNDITILDIPSESDSRAIENEIKIYY